MCSSCSGIHREMNHKGVKGVGMSNFTDKDVEEMSKKGNEVSHLTLDNHIIGSAERIDGGLQCQALSSS